MQSGKPLTITYDTNDDSEQKLAINLGCNGVIDVLMEPITESNNPLLIFQELSNQNQSIAVATVYRSQEINGERFILKNDGNIVQRFDDVQLNELVESDLHDALSESRSFTKKYLLEESEVEIFIEVIQPKISLTIFGGGVDARPVSALAKMIGWNVSVTDECVAHIAPLFFPTADNLSLCHREFIERDLQIDSSTACVLMSHNYDYDRDVLKQLLKTSTPYIGIMGPRKRLDKMLLEFEAQGIQLTADDRQRIHAPIGLDIAAETSEEIALSIIAEIQAKFHNRQGGFLKDRRATIHERDPQTNQVLKKAHV
jgi:xanthine/CO dehydrogenase XdhC/CoxF family maturation factor